LTCPFFKKALALEPLASAERPKKRQKKTRVRFPRAGQFGRSIKTQEFFRENRRKIIAFLACDGKQESLRSILLEKQQSVPDFDVSWKIGFQAAALPMRFVKKYRFSDTIFHFRVKDRYPHGPKPIYGVRCAWYLDDRQTGRPDAIAHRAWPV